MRSTLGRRVRIPIRSRGPAPDHLGAALAAFGRAVRAHRRLARLAPRFFDSAVVERERRESEARRRWSAECEAALAKIYGSEYAPQPTRTDDLPLLPPPKVQLAVEQELTLCELWLAAGSVALARHRRRRPQPLVSLTRIARLLELGFALRLLACGADFSLPPRGDVSHLP